jgi:hypothetical protein
MRADTMPARPCLPMLALAFLALWGPAAALSRAQEAQPVYPAYDGFLKNPDGSYTLAFGYFSHNAAAVTIPPGPGNTFSPGPADRLQPTTFKPGHWRFQCVMVVAPDFDGRLTWTLGHAGTTTGTSQRMLQSNWYLVEGAGELKQIDHAKATRDVCLNRAPGVRVLGTGRDHKAPVPATVGEAYSLFGSVADEGLPRGGALTTAWTQVAGPAPVTFENASQARTRATFSAPGDYELELSASDSELSSSFRLHVTALPATR